MRFKKGDKVEVLSRKEVPSGAWRSAEILCGNGHNYTVKYDGYTGTTDQAVMERVSRKTMRPCPPLLRVAKNCFPGDVVEVFDNFFWKMATISKIVGRKYFLVRLLGSSLEFKVSRSDVRLRQSWEDNNWVVIGQVSSGCEDATYGEILKMDHQDSTFQVKKTNRRINVHVKDDFSAPKNKPSILDSHIAYSRVLKRGSPYCYSQGERYSGAAKKFRAVEKDGRLDRLITADSSLLPKQVDDVAYSREIPVVKHMHPSVHNGKTEFFELEAERRKPSGAAGSSLAVNLESEDADSVMCSVGSCSISSENSYKLPRHVSAGPREDSNGNCSDAESFCQLGYKEGNCVLPTKEELAAEIHRLELHAYRCTIEALHASGPLSWEQEELVTNLRLSLHISNDEHLMELRNLISSENSHLRAEIGRLYIPRFQMLPPVSLRYMCC